MARKATAAKSTGAPPAEPEPKSARVYTEEERSVHNAITHMKRVAEGKVAKASDENVKDAKAAVELYKGFFSKEEKLEFAKKVEGSKASKNYSWVRTFKETMKTRKTESSGVIENYYTRIAVIASPPPPTCTLMCVWRISQHF